MPFTDKTIREIVAAFEHDRKKKGEFWIPAAR
jgi:hypothetical protein